MTFLSDELLDRIHSRAPECDRTNTFCADDLSELAEAGYLRALIPQELGGQGLSLSQLVSEQRRLAQAAPATALAVNMHLVWTGVAAMLYRRGDRSLEFVLREAAAGEVFALAISEPGNDLTLFGSTTDAAPQPDGGYAFTGTKIFTSLSPAWTRLALFGLDTASDDAPKLVHAVVARDAPGIEIAQDWDTMGMRASQSNSTFLTSVPAAPERVFRRLDPGPSRDQLIFAIFANFETLLSAVYTGIGERALELAVGAANSRVSVKNGGRPLRLDPDVRRRIAEAALALDGILPQLEVVARDLDDDIDRGEAWFRSLVGLKVSATQIAQFVVKRAVSVAGGASYFAGSELGRLHRDVLAGGFHPSTDDSALSTIADSVLGPAEPWQEPSTR